MEEDSQFKNDEVPHQSECPPVGRPKLKAVSYSEEEVSRMADKLPEKRHDCTDEKREKDQLPEEKSKPKRKKGKDKKNK